MELPLSSGAFGVFEGGQGRQEAENGGNMFTLKGGGGEKT